MDSPYVANFVQYIRTVPGIGSREWGDQRVGMARAIELAKLPPEDRERTVGTLAKLTEAEVGYRAVLLRVISS